MSPPRTHHRGRKYRNKFFIHFPTLKPNETQGTETHPGITSAAAVLGWAFPLKELDKALPPLLAKLRNVSPVAAQRTRKKMILFLQRHPLIQAVLEERRDGIGV